MTLLLHSRPSMTGGTSASAFVRTQQGSEGAMAAAGRRSGICLHVGLGLHPLRPAALRGYSGIARSDSRRSHLFDQMSEPSSDILDAFNHCCNTFLAYVA
jgi:hypothetical protein